MTRLQLNGVSFLMVLLFVSGPTWAQVTISNKGPRDFDPTWMFTFDDGHTDPDLSLRPCDQAFPSASCAAPFPSGQEQCLAVVDGGHPSPIPPADGYCVEPVDCRFTSVDSCAGMLFLDAGENLRGVYVAFEVTNIGTTSYSDVWVTMSGFADDDAGGSPQLVRPAAFEAVNPNDPMDQWYAAKRIGALSPAEHGTVFFYLEVIDDRSQTLPSNDATRPEVAVWDGFPNFPLATATNIIQANVDNDNCLDTISGSATGLNENGSCDDGATGSVTAQCLAGTDVSDCADPGSMNGAPRSPFSDCSDPDRLFRRPCIAPSKAIEWPFIYTDTIQNPGNKLFSMSLSANPVLAGAIDITVDGDSGQPGIIWDIIPGDDGDPEAVIGISPTGIAGFDSRGLELVSTQVTFSGPTACGAGLDCSCTVADDTNCQAGDFFLGCETSDVDNNGIPDNTCIVAVANNDLEVVFENDDVVLYRAVYTFRPTSVFNPIPIIPLQYIVSGQQVKHTAVSGASSCLFDTGIDCPGGVAECETDLPGQGAVCTNGNCLVLDSADPTCACNDDTGVACSSGGFECGSNLICNPTTSTCGGLFCLPTPDVTGIISKTVSVSVPVPPGTTVTHELTITNTGPVATLTIDEIIDQLPMQPDCLAASPPCGPATPIYVPGSTRIDSLAAPDPVVVGTSLVWVNQFTIPPAGSVVLEYDAVYGLASGIYSDAALALVGSIAGQGGSAIDSTGGAPANLPSNPCSVDADCAVFGADNHCRNKACVLPASADVVIISSCGDDNVFPDCAISGGEPPDCEQCDHAGQSDTCDADCSFAFCPDGTVNSAAGESCDEGGDTATCDGDCTPPACGDGYVNQVFGEACDCGTDINNQNPSCLGFNGGAECEVNCQPPTCSDGFLNLENGEECDDGNFSNSDGCTNQCRRPTCGDGIPQTVSLVATAIACDPVNGIQDCIIAGLGLASICQINPAVGFEVCHIPEVCDCGVDPVSLPPGCGDINGIGECSDLCQMPICGDSITSPSCSALSCDDGGGVPDQAICDSQFGVGGGPAYVCSPLTLVCEPFVACVSDAQCAGFGPDYACEDFFGQLSCQQQPPACEECDNPLAPQLCSPGPNGCDAIRCGDGELDQGESCDPAIADPMKSGFEIGCDAQCQFFCGDGGLDPTESCDDSNNTSGDGCSVSCAIESASITLSKAASPTQFDGEGQTITYTIEITNTGAATLYNVVVSDPLVTNVDCGSGSNVIIEIVGGASVTCTASYTTAQADLNAGRIENTASVAGAVLDGRQVAANDNATVTTDVLFADGFEIGTTGAWSGVVKRWR